MVYPADEETFDERVSPEFIRDDHSNLIQAFLKRLQDFLGYGGRVHDKFGLVYPVGGWIGYGGLTAPNGWLLCDGKAYDYTDSDYSDLYAVIGIKYGSPWVDYFNVPDFRGCFCRGYSKIASVNFDPADVNTTTDRITLSGQTFHRTCFPVRFTTSDVLPAPLAINTTYFLYIAPNDEVLICTNRDNALAATKIILTTQGTGTHTIHPYIEEDKDTRVKLTSNSGDQEDLGSYQEDAFQKHYHKVLDFEAYVIYRSDWNARSTWSGPRSYSDWYENAFNAKDIYTDGSFPEPKETIETRPRNVNVNYIIKR